MSDTGSDAQGAGAVAAPAAPRRRPWLWVVLVISLALNLLVAGAVIGHVASERGAGFFGGGPRDAWHEGRRLLGKLPRERRQVILDAVRAHRGEFDEHRADVWAARREVAAVLEREDASSAEIDQAFAALGAKEAEAVAAMRAVFGEVAGLMTPEERQTFARRVLRREPRFAPRWEREDE